MSHRRAVRVSPEGCSCKGAPMLSLVMEGPKGGAGIATSALLTDLAGALVQEQRLIGELRQALLRQRAGVATGDLDLIDGSVYAIARTRLTLEEARRRRASLTASVGGRPGIALSELESFVGVLPAPLLAAREAVRRAAEATAHDLAINQKVLRRALEAGDAFLQQLFSSAFDTMAETVPSLRPADSRPSGPVLGTRKRRGYASTDRRR